MICTNLYKVFLLLVCSVFITTVSAADACQNFADVWKDEKQKISAKMSFEHCFTNAEGILNLTKHLMASKHVVEISEINGRLPASWLLIAQKGDTIHLFKFLRKLYTIKKIYESIIEEHTKGKLLTYLQRKQNNLRPLKDIFANGAGHSVTARQSECVLKVIEDIETQLKTQISHAKAIQFAEAFERQLKINPESILKNNPRSTDIENLTARVKKEIELYKTATIDVVELQKLYVNVSDLSHLTELIGRISRTTTTPMNWHETIKRIKEAVNPFFQSTMLKQIDDLVVELFVPTIKKYTNSFAESPGAFDTATKNFSQRENKNSLQKENIATLVFERIFEPEEFKTFVLSALSNDQTQGLAAPQYKVNVRAVLKSRLEAAGAADSLIIKEGEFVFRIAETYLATFFPEEAIDIAKKVMNLPEDACAVATQAN